MSLWRRQKIAKTPLFLQMESVECGAASLGMILGYYGAYYSLETLRGLCSISRDGVKASAILRVAQQLGLEGQGLKKERIDDLKTLTFPLIVFWNFNHFLVVEGLDDQFVWINDPAQGRYKLTHAAFSASFTGVVLTFSPGPQFQKTGEPFSIRSALKPWLKDQKWPLLFLFFTGLLLIVPGLLIPILSKLFVDHFMIERQLGWFAGLLWAMGISIMAQGALLALLRLNTLRLEMALAVSHTSQFVWKLLNLPMSFFYQRSGGEIASRLILPGRISESIANQVVGLAVQAFSASFYLVIMALYDWRLTLLVLGIVALNVGIMATFLDHQKQAIFVLGRENGKVTEAALNGIRAIETLKATGRESEFFRRITSHQIVMSNARQKLSAAQEKISLLPGLSLGICQLLLFGIGGWRAMSGELSLGSLVAFQALTIGFLKPISDLVFSTNALQQLEADLSRIRDVYLYPSAAAAPLSKETIAPFKGEIRIENLTFGYSRSDAPLIDNLTLTIPAGAHVAFIGESGSGKSTLAKLLCGLYTPWAGQIWIDGVSLETISPEIRAELMGMVDQEIVLFEGSIRDNLKLWDDTIEDEALVIGAKDAEIHDMVSTRPHGYDAPVEEGGRNMSGGERQRLELARVLIRNPKILILDEATSALDPLVELQVDRNIKQRHVTTVHIAHRLSTIRDSHLIVLLDKGKIIAQGTHDALLSDPAYARLVNSQ